MDRFSIHSGNINIRGPIILYHTRTSGHVSKIHLWIAASECLFNSSTSNGNALYCQTRFYACLEVGACQLLARFALTSINGPLEGQVNFLFIRTYFIYSIKNSKTHLFYYFRRNLHSLGMHFYWPIWGGSFQCPGAFPPISLFLFGLTTRSL